MGAVNHPVPEGKRALNIHISVEEMEWITAEAKKRGVSKTTVVRSLIWAVRTGEEQRAKRK